MTDYRNEAGEAMYAEAGEVKAYLDGLNSNVAHQEEVYEKANITEDEATELTEVLDVENYVAKEIDKQNAIKAMIERLRQAEIELEQS
jgi:hypothetical protein